jgi:hypothetical protein
LYRWNLNSRTKEKKEEIGPLEIQAYPQQSLSLQIASHTIRKTATVANTALGLVTWVRKWLQNALTLSTRLNPKAHYILPAQWRKCQF